MFSGLTQREQDILNQALEEASQATQKTLQEESYQVYRVEQEVTIPANNGQAEVKKWTIKHTDIKYTQETKALANQIVKINTKVPLDVNHEKQEITSKLSDVIAFAKEIKKISASLINFEQTASLQLLTNLMALIHAVPESLKRKYAQLMNDEWNVFNLFGRLTFANSDDSYHATPSLIQLLPNILSQDIDEIIKLLIFINEIEEAGSNLDKLSKEQQEYIARQKSVKELSLIKNKDAEGKSKYNKEKNELEKIVSSCGINLKSIRAICDGYQTFYSLKRIVQNIKDIQSTANPSNEEERYAILYRIGLIGEHIKKIPKWIKNQYPMVPWESFIGIRDCLEHQLEYEAEGKIQALLNGDYIGEGITISALIGQANKLEPIMQEVINRHYSVPRSDILDYILKPPVAPTINKPLKYPDSKVVNSKQKNSLITAHSVHFLKELLVGKAGFVSSTQKKELSELQQNHLDRMNTADNILQVIANNKTEILKDISEICNSFKKANKKEEEAKEAILSLIKGSSIFNNEAFRTLIESNIDSCENAKFSYASDDDINKSCERLLQIIESLIKLIKKNHELASSGMEGFAKWNDENQRNTLTWLNNRFEANITESEFSNFIDIIAEIGHGDKWYQFLVEIKIKDTDQFYEMNPVDINNSFNLINGAAKKIIFTRVVSVWKELPTKLLVRKLYSPNDASLSPLQIVEATIKYIASASKMICEKFHDHNFKHENMKKTHKIHQTKLNAFNNLTPQQIQLLETLKALSESSPGLLAENGPNNLNAIEMAYIASGIHQQLEEETGHLREEEESLIGGYISKYNDSMKPALETNINFRDALQYFLKLAALNLKDLIVVDPFQKDKVFVELALDLIVARNYLAHDDEFIMSMFLKNTNHLMEKSGLKLEAIIFPLQDFVDKMKPATQPNNGTNPSSGQTNVNPLVWGFPPNIVNNNSSSLTQGVKPPIPKI